jgi:hypothetical protein
MRVGIRDHIREEELDQDFEGWVGVREEEWPQQNIPESIVAQH